MTSNPDIGAPVYANLEGEHAQGIYLGPSSNSGAHYVFVLDAFARSAGRALEIERVENVMPCGESAQYQDAVADARVQRIVEQHRRLACVPA